MIAVALSELDAQFPPFESDAHQTPTRYIFVDDLAEIHSE